MTPTVSILDCKAGPGGLVAVTARLEDGSVRRLILPKRLAGVAEVEWSTQALSTLTQLSMART